jgi:hypothetical protein
MTDTQLVLAAISYLLAAFGFSYIVGHSKISRPVRLALWDVGDHSPILRYVVLLMECPACLGFWIGLITGIVAVFAFDQHGFIPVALSLITTAANFLLGRMTGLISDPDVDD